MTTKLTLSVEAEVVRRAKRHARAHGTSVSYLVGQFLALVSTPSARTPAAPVLRALRGSLGAGGREQHRRHLVEQYR